MSKIIRVIQNYLLLGFPFVVACMVWQTFQSPNETAVGVKRILWNALGCNLMLWFIALILFLVILVVLPTTREKTLRRLANIKERDERELYITGRAARTTYIATLSVIILLLFLSIFSLRISKLPETQDTHQKKLSVNIGLHFGLLEESTTEKTTKENVLFESKNIQLSQSAILLILLSCQLLIFNLTARKEQKKDEA